MSQPESSSPRIRVVQLAFAAALVLSWWASRVQEVADEDALPVLAGLAFEEVAADLGLSFSHEMPRLDPALEHILPQIAGTGASIAAVDFDGDGRLDLYATTMAAGKPNALFRNLGDDRFEDVAARVGLADLNRAGEAASHGSVWADVDRDGDQDVIVYKWGRSQLLLQGPDGVFEDASATAGLDHWMNCTTAMWFDYDRDGRLDLFMGGYYREDTNLWSVDSTRVLHEDGEFARNGGRNYVFRNLGPGADGALRFEEVADALGLADERWTYGVGSADFDRDGWPDVYVANDYGVEQLFFNRGGTFFEEATDLGLDAKSKSGMCVSLGDVTNSARLCVYVTNITEPRWLFQGNNLRVSWFPEERRLENITVGGGHPAQECGWAWGADFGDLDNDGDQDLVVVNGFHSADPERSYWYQMDKLGGATGQLLEDAANWPPFDGMSLSGHQRSRVLLNLGRGGRRMLDVAGFVGVDDRLDGRAVVLADLFDDGTLDMIVANQNGPLLVYRNMRPAADDWIGYRLVGRASNLDAIGAEVVAHIGASSQLQVVTAGSGFCSQTDPRVHFGLGHEPAPERVEILWPSGRRQTLPAAALVAGRYHRIEEPVE